MIHWLLFLACGWNAASPTPEPTAPAARLAEANAIARAVGRGLEPCEELVSTMATGGTPTAASVTRACGPVRALYDGHYPDSVGQTRSTDWLLGEVARVAEDVDYVLRELDGGRHLASAKEHLQRSVGDCKKVVANVLDKKVVFPVRGVAVANPEGEWDRTVGNGIHDYGGLLEYIQRYAYGQGLDPDSVRDRMLRHYARAADARLHSLEAFGAKVERKHRRVAYLDATRILVKTYDRIVEAYANGEVRSEDRRQELWTAMQTADTAWRTAQASAADSHGSHGDDHRDGGEE